MFASRYRALCLGLAAGLVWAFTVRAEVQDPKLAPTFGSAELKVGYLPDPHKVMVTAGGPVETKLGGFTHFVGKAPDFRLTYTSGPGVPLTIHVDSQADTTLLINLPDSTWIAIDDVDGNKNPMIKFDKPMSGVYDIFVGTYGKDPAPATLFITEFPVGKENKKEDAPDPSLPPTFGAANLKVGYLPDPHTVKVNAGGNIKTNLGNVSACVARAPDFRLTYTAGAAPLTFHVESGADTTLLINLPNGTWIADDDSGGGTNPLIRLAQPMTGVYDVYVGTFGSNPVPAAPAVLFITELK